MTLSGTGSLPSTPAPFDRQAASFDHRAGLPESCCQQIAEAVMEIAALQPDDRLVEVGCGTGQIGVWWVRAGVHYLGFDLSQEMLERFRQRIQSFESTAAWTLAHADGNQTWPVGNQSVQVIFSSRAMHLLETEQVTQEILRVADPAGAVLLIGRVQRDPNSLRSQLRKQMHQIMIKLGWSPRQGERLKQTLLDQFFAQGATPIAPQIVSRWPTYYTPVGSLDQWAQKSGLAGLEELPDTDKQMILSELRVWAQTTWGQDLDQTIEEEDCYVLQGVHLASQG